MLEKYSGFTLVFSGEVTAMKTQKILSSLIFLLLIGTLLFRADLASAQTPGSIKWFFVTSMDPLSGVPGSPAIADDGTIYAGSLNGNFYAINPDGTLKWSFDAGVPIAYTPAIGDDGTIYVNAASGLYAFYPDGTIKWWFSADCLFLGGPAIAKDGTIYIGSNVSKLFAIRPNGTQEWEFEITSAGQVSDPVIGMDGTIYFGTAFSDQRFYAVYPNGTKKWEYYVGANVVGSPAIARNGTIYFGAMNAKLYALNPNGTKKWEYYAKWGGIRSSPAIGADGTIYFGTDASNLHAVNPNATVQWVFHTWGSVGSSPAIGANGIIYFGSMDTFIYALHPHGSEYWDRGTEGQVHSSPVIADDGIMYIGCRHSVKAIYTDSYGLANSAWPMYRANPKRTARVDKFFISIKYIKFLIKNIVIIDLNKGVKNSLTTKLNSAINALKDERPGPAVNKLNAFIHEVDALSRKKIADDNAADLIRHAQAIIDSL